MMIITAADQPAGCLLCSEPFTDEAQALRIEHQGAVGWAHQDCGPDADQPVLEAHLAVAGWIGNQPPFPIEFPTDTRTSTRLGTAESTRDDGDVTAARVGQNFIHRTGEYRTTTSIDQSLVDNALITARATPTITARSDNVPP